MQADREPTRLPSLSQPVLAQAEGEGPEPLSAAQDRKVKTDGDLRKLLLKTPSGAKDVTKLTGDNGWLDIGDYANALTESDEMFPELVESEFRRAAATELGGGELVRRGDPPGPVPAGGARHRRVPGRQLARAGHRGAGPFQVRARARRTSPSSPDEGRLSAGVQAEAHAWRGDIAMEIWIYSSKAVPKAMIMDLAKRQMERL